MIPTNELRFVERTVEMHPFFKTTNARGETITATQTYRVLQQKFGVFRDGQMCPPYEWRDVPLVKERA